MAIREFISSFSNHMLGLHPLFGNYALNIRALKRKKGRPKPPFLAHEFRLSASGNSSGSAGTYDQIPVPVGNFFVEVLHGINFI